MDASPTGLRMIIHLMLIKRFWWDSKKTVSKNTAPIQRLRVVRRKTPWDRMWEKTHVFLPPPPSGYTRFRALNWKERTILISKDIMAFYVWAFLVVAIMIWCYEDAIVPIRPLGFFVGSGREWNEPLWYATVRILTWGILDAVVDIIRQPLFMLYHTFIFFKVRVFLYS